MTQVGTQTGTAVSTKVAGMFTPVIDLNDIEPSINKKFDLAVVGAKDFIMESKNSKLQAEERNLKNVMYVGAGAIVISGILAPFAIAAATAVISVSIAGVTAIAFFGYCKYRLPFKMKALEAELSVKLEQLESETLLKLKQVKLEHLKRLTSLAEKNPIETLHVELETMGKEADAIGKANTLVRTQYIRLGDDLTKGKKENPKFDFSSQDKQLKDLSDMCEADDAELTSFVQVYEEMKDVYKKAKFDWDFALKLDSAMAERDKARGNETQRKILADTALETIKQKNAELFARVRTRAVKLSASKTIKVAGLEVDVSSVSIDKPVTN